MSGPLTIADLEEKLGPPEEFMLTLDSRPYLAQWALAIGVHPAQVFAMNPVQLSNLYHEKGNTAKLESSELQRIAADIFIRLMETMQLAKVDPDFMRAMIRKEIEDLPTRKIEIIGLPQQTIFDGPIHCMTEHVIGECSIGHHIMLVGPAGCGKTTIGNHTSIALQMPFYITSTINDTHELTGFVDGNGTYHPTPFRNAYQNGGLWVADELDAWDASALLAANSALANGYSVFPDSPVPVMRHPNFRMIGTANTFGHGADRVYVGRNQLDAATLDRFATMNVDYDLKLERQICLGNVTWLNYVWRIRKAVLEKNIRHVVSSRAILNGARSLARGTSLNNVKEWYLFKGMSTKDREKIDDIKTGKNLDDDIPF